MAQRRVKKLVIDRKRWLHGEGKDNSSLCRSEDGKMCCLGFYMRSIGMKISEIKDAPGPSLLEWCNVPPWLLTGMYDSSQSIKLMKLNDGLHVKDREKKIAAIFAKHDVEVSFTGKAGK